MEIFNYRGILPQKNEDEPGSSMRWLTTEDMGAKVMIRLVEMERGFPVPGYPHSPPWLDKHTYEHGVFVLKGKGTVRNDKEEREIKEGDVIFIAPNEPHAFRNTGNKTLRFLCIIPSGVLDGAKPWRKLSK